MAIDFTSFNAALNKVIRPAIEAQMYARAPMWQLLGGWSAEKPAPTRANVLVDRFENNKMYVPLRLSYHSGYAAVGISEKYNYGQPKISESYSSIKTLVTSFTIPKQLLNVKDAGAIVKPLKFYSESASRDLAMHANRQVYGSGNAVVALAGTSGSSSTTLTLKASLNGDIDHARYLPEGSRIKIGSGAATTVTAQTGDNTVTLADARNWSADDTVVLLTGDDNAMQEIDGFAGMIAASGVYQALDPANAYSWVSPVDTQAETIYTAGIQKKIHTQFFKANKVGNVKWIIMNSSAFQCYGNSLQGQIRFQAKDVLSGGWKGLDYMQGNAEILLDYDCPDDTILGLTVEDVVFGEFQKFDFEKGTDGVMLKIAGKLDYEVTGSWMGNLGTVARAAHFALRNKTFSQNATA